MELRVKWIKSVELSRGECSTARRRCLSRCRRVSSMSPTVANRFIVGLFPLRYSSNSHGSRKFWSHPLKSPAACLLFTFDLVLLSLPDSFIDFSLGDEGGCHPLATAFLSFSFSIPRRWLESSVGRIFSPPSSSSSHSSVTTGIRIANSRHNCGPQLIFTFLLPKKGIKMFEFDVGAIGIGS